MIASSTTPLRHLVAELDQGEAAVPGILVIEEVPLEPTRVSRPTCALMTELHRLDLSALARRRGLGPFLASAGHRR